MAYDDNDLKKKRKRVPLIPPPPPYLVPSPAPGVPNQGGQLLGPGAAPQLQAQQAQMDPRTLIPGYSPVQAPQGLPADYANQFSLDPQDLQNMQSDRGRLQAANEAALGQLNDIHSQFLPSQVKQNPDGSFAPVMPQSPADQFLNSQIQQQIMQNLKGNNSRGSRFETGFNMGQRLAASIVVPAMGAFAKGPGSALGAVEASQALNQQAQQAQAQERADRNQRNEMILHLANMYQDVSPTSGRNIAKLAASELDRQKYNRELLHQAQTGVNETGSKLAEADKGIAELRGRSRTEQGKALLEKANLDVKRSEFGQKNNQEAIGLSQHADNVVLRGKELDMQGKNYDLQNAKAGGEADRADNRLEFDQSKEKDAQLDGLERILRMNGSAATATHNGQLTHPGWLEYLQQNPTIKGTIERKMKAAGVPGSVEDAFKTLGMPAATQNAGDPWNWLGDNIKKMFAPKGQASAAPAAAPAPAKVAPTLDELLKERERRKQSKVASSG